MDCATKGIITDEIYEDAQVKRLLTLAKENMVQDFERRYEERFNKRNEELKREYEEQYRSQIDEYINKTDQQNTIIENHKKDINILKEETKSKDIKIDKLEEELKKCETELVKTNEASSKLLFEFYKVKTGSTISDKFEDIDFCLSLNNDVHNHVLSIAKLFKLPPIRKLYFDYCENPNSDLLEFLKNSSPVSSKIFTFGWNRRTTHFMPIDYYIDGLEVVLKGVTQEIYIHAWTISNDSLQRLVKAGAGATKFVIRGFKNALDSDLDFSGTEYKIQYFGLPYNGDHQGEDWSGQPEKLERIIKGFSQCGIKDSLQTLSVCGCGVADDKVKKMLNDHGMGTVNVVLEPNDPTV